MMEEIEDQRPETAPRSEVSETHFEYESKSCHGSRKYSKEKMFLENGSTSQVILFIYICFISLFILF